MANSIQASKKRIATIKSTLKISKAMELVAIAKLKKARRYLDEIHDYNNALYDCLNKLNIDDQYFSPYFADNGNNKNFYIIISANFGLCGGYNINLFKEAINEIKKDDYLFIFGQKGIAYFKDYNIVGTSDANYENADLEELINLLLDYYDKKLVGKIKLIYTMFVNSLTFTPTTVNLLPLKKIKNKKTPLIIEPSLTEILPSLISFYLRSMINNYLIQSEVSEQASRRAAMEQSSDNATSIIEELRIELNKVRQQNITNQISEIIAGADV